MDNKVGTFKSYTEYIKDDSIKKIVEKIQLGPINKIINIVNIDNQKTENH